MEDEQFDTSLRAAYGKDGLFRKAAVLVLAMLEKVKQE